MHFHKFYGLWEHCLNCVKIVHVASVSHTRCYKRLPKCTVHKQCWMKYMSPSHDPWTKDSFQENEQKPF